MREAAEALRLTAQDLQALGVIDRIVPEPHGGAHRHRAQVISGVGNAIAAMLGELDWLEGPALREDRRRKFLDLGQSGLAA
jgi:acetyl-CoA carboxylase carboxyl transferase subunit alpha